LVTVVLPALFFARLGAKSFSLSPFLGLPNVVAKVLCELAAAAVAVFSLLRLYYSVYTALGRNFSEHLFCVCVYFHSFVGERNERWLFAKDNENEGIEWNIAKAKKIQLSVFV
jgi:hypothetical protein